MNSCFFGKEQCEQKYTIEPHGDGYALYYGRCSCRHGFNLVYLTEPAHNCDLKRLEALLNLGKDYEQTISSDEMQANPH